MCASKLTGTRLRALENYPDKYFLCVILPATIEAILEEQIYNKLVYVEILRTVTFMSSCSKL